MELEPMKILVFGGAGFIGSNLVEAMSCEGHTITIVDNLTTSFKGFSDIYSYPIHNMDIRQFNHFQNLKVDADVVVHLAASGNVVQSISNTRENFETNVVGTLNVLEFTRLNKIPKLIFASTGGAIMGNTMPPVSESSLPSPISPYGASKLAGEGYCEAYANSFGLNITALRFGNVIGKYCSSKQGIMNKVFDAILHDQTFNVYGDGLNTRDYVPVSNIVQGIISACKTNSVGFRRYHLSTGIETSILDFLQLCFEASGTNHQTLKISYLPDRLGEVSKNFANYDLAKNQLKYSPDVTLLEELKNAWNWYSRFDKKQKN